MPKLLHTLCCCVSRPGVKSHKEKSYKQSNLDDSGTVNPASIITQVNKCDEVLNAKTTGGARLRGAPTGAGNAAAAVAAPITEGQTTSVPALAVNSAISVTSPLPTDQFVLRGTAAAIADFKADFKSEKEMYKDCLLPAPRSHDTHKKCLIVDLDETLVHSSFKPVKNADFIIPVEIDNVVHQVYVLKRPYADEFLERIGTMFECVLFTASLAKYADPVADLLDKRGTFRARLFREACVFFGGNYVKDLDRLGRDLEKVVIIDNSPASYAFHPENAVPVRTWFDDPHDCELLDMLPLLEEIADSHNIYHVLQRISGCGAGQQAYGSPNNDSTAAAISYGNVISMASPTNTNYNNNNNNAANNKRHNNNNYIKHCRNNNDNNYDTPATMSTNTTTVITSSSSLPISYGNNNNSMSRNYSRTNNRDRNNNNNNNNTAQIFAYSNSNNRGFGNNNNESRFRSTDSKR